MPQTFYIESDEEIISVIGHLRKSSQEENIFVFPKRALVLQSIINLRLLEREAGKLGKKIIIVSQDEVGRMLAEKAGLETENYSEDFSQKSSYMELTPAGAEPTQFLSGGGAVPKEANMPHLDAIGSSNFYVAQESTSGTKSVPAPAVSSGSGMPLRVRNTTPEKLTSLNSKRFDQMSALSGGQTPSHTSNVATFPAQFSFLPSQSSPPRLKRTSESDRSERLKNFYSGTTKATATTRWEEEPKPIPSTTVGKRARMIFFALGGISLFSLVTVILFFFLPKAEVQVTPYRIVQTVDKEFDGTAGGSASDENPLAVRILEKEKEVSVTVATTGTSGGTSQKAHGSVIIYNNYSTDSQSLVATTRFETTDGKIFRLESGVTVPAMTTINGKQEPGAIEAQVIADQAGEGYNIDATTFTIPGFKGGPKYDKFSAKSTKAMVGGGSSGISDVAIVAKVDLDTALREAEGKAKETFLNEVRDGLTEEEKILDDQIDIVPLVSPDLPSVGTVANAIDYNGSFAVRAFVFSEKVIKEKIQDASEKNIQGILFQPIVSSVTYADSSADFSQGVIRIRAHALVTMESDIDEEKLRGMLLGKNEEGIKQVLESFPEIKNIQVLFHPEWFVSSIPNSLERVSIVTLPGEDKP